MFPFQIVLLFQKKVTMTFHLRRLAPALLLLIFGRVSLQYQDDPIYYDSEDEDYENTEDIIDVSNLTKSEPCVCQTPHQLLPLQISICHQPNAFSNVSLMQGSL